MFFKFIKFNLFYEALDWYIFFQSILSFVVQIAEQIYLFTGLRWSSVGIILIQVLVVGYPVLILIHNRFVFYLYPLSIN